MLVRCRLSARAPAGRLCGEHQPHVRSRRRPSTTRRRALVIAQGMALNVNSGDNEESLRRNRGGMTLGAGANVQTKAPDDKDQQSGTMIITFAQAYSRWGARRADRRVARRWDARHHGRLSFARCQCLDPGDGNRRGQRERWLSDPRARTRCRPSRASTWASPRWRRDRHRGAEPATCMSLVFSTTNAAQRRRRRRRPERPGWQRHDRRWPELSTPRPPATAISTGWMGRHRRIVGTRSVRLIVHHGGDGGELVSA